MRTLKEIIELTEKRLENPDMSPESRAREEDHLRQHRSLQRLLAVVHDEMMPVGKKFCYRHGQWMVDQCEVCESCLGPEDLAWNEEDE